MRKRTRPARSGCKPGLSWAWSLYGAVSCSSRIVKRTVTIILGLVCAAALVRAVPPPAPARIELAKRSELIAIVTVTNVTDRFTTDVAWKRGQRQSAVATVNRIIKGTAPRTLRLTYAGPPLSLSCRPPNLSTGQFLMFLCRQGDGFVRTDNWYSQATITTNHVIFPMERAVDLKIAVDEIERIVQSR
jgi:hypothetical protein